MTFKKGTDNKSANLRIRFTPSEKEKATTSATQAGLTLSEYIRRRATGMPVRSKADDQTINELRRLGGLLKQIHLQSGGAYSQQTASALTDIAEAIKRIGT